ncbi:helix-turn-helix transcriptional regulator [Mycobacterium intracellulare]|uniref:helix-turn-helix transcriptional regulator n=1 Tax=Mycobacterium intracellulare TaxID=1767 RepID=UPI001CD99DF5|nr:helix-turn-helix transcriptional regulator [Mycobacterium intracellulare]MCA2304863.1 helix-turn-helix transcriptional regulator [Mycobacterium intracellulare]MCA2347106.1 helix-turn-helix transcriptional regulator [Mycobacterium intracellulare]
MSASAPSDDSPIERVGKAVADRRVEVGFETQRELAEAAGVSLNTAALLERGKSFPHRVNRIKFEDALQWPRGTLDALRRGQPIPETAPRPAVPPAHAPAAATDPRTNLQALGIAKAVAAIAATCTQILVSHNNNPQAKAALRELDDQLLQLESLIAASLPHVGGSSFSETMSALTQLHEYRDIIRDAAAVPAEGASRPGGGPRTRMASARS